MDRLLSAIEAFRKANKYPVTEQNDDTAVGRAQAKLYDALVNDNVSGMAKQLAALRSDGLIYTVRKKIKDFLDSRHPITGAERLNPEDVSKFMATVDAETRADIKESVADFDRSARYAETKFALANRLIPSDGKVLAGKTPETPREAATMFTGF